jgi:hypothetical protein
MISMFTWEQLEERVCGAPDVDIEALKQICDVRCSDFPYDEELEQHFWECLQEFSNKERCMFIRFTCGLSRLPLDYHPSKRLKIIFFFQEEDSLPRASTCFWSLYVPKYPAQHNKFWPDYIGDQCGICSPHNIISTIGLLVRYSSKEMLKHRLKTAFLHCTDIDADYTIN